MIKIIIRKEYKRQKAEVMNKKERKRRKREREEKEKRRNGKEENLSRPERSSWVKPDWPRFSAGRARSISVRATLRSPIIITGFDVDCFRC